MKGTQNPQEVSTKLRKIAKLAREKPEEPLVNLAHHIDVEFLREAYRRTRKDGAAGVDGQRAEEYADNLEENLTSLLNRFKSGSYRAPPVRRVNIPKGRNQTRAIGIPTFEDKVLQRSATMVLEAVYEQDFYDCSYGFRPGRSAHQALQVLWDWLMKHGGGWVIEVDIRNYFDAISHTHLRSFLDQRVRDGVLRRIIHKWLKAGVLESGNIRYPGKGSPQGGVVSPILSNVYLHEVMDKWFEREVKPRLRGPAILVRFADDMIVACRLEDDARRIMEVLPKRFGRFNLELHPEKTRLVDFRRPGRDERKGNGSFDFLGFSHYWCRSRKGRWVPKRKTAKDRFARSVRAIKETCRAIRHEKLSRQHDILSQKLRGHYAYFGITGNFKALNRLLYATEHLWLMWLNQRSSGNYMTWDRFRRMLGRYSLPKPVLVHSSYSPVAKP